MKTETKGRVNFDGFNMKWYKFLVNGGLYIVAALWTALGLYLLFNISAALANKDFLTVVVGGLSRLLTVAAVVGPFIGMALITRSYLKNFKKIAPGYVYALSVIHIIITLLVIPNAIKSTPSQIFGIVFSVILIVAQLILLALNFVYFSKREKIFDNEEKTLKWHHFLRVAFFVYAVVMGISAVLLEVNVFANAIINFSTLGFFGVIGEIIKNTLIIIFYGSIPYFAWFASKNLKKFKKEAPGSVYLVFFWTIVVYVIGCILAYLQKTVALLSTATIGFILTFVYLCVVLALNYIYFEKREELFCNE